jgi:glycosyltransferase involved in cell wall biosynthesis
MVRLLHLLDHDADFQTRRSVESLTQGLGNDFHSDTRTLGRGGEDRGILASIGRLRGETTTDRFDLIHAWGTSALTAAAFGATGGAKIVYTPPPHVKRRSLGWLRAVMGYRDVHVICPTATMRRTIVERGVPIERAHLIRPGVEFSRIKRRRDPALRAALGLKEDDFVLMSPGESTRAADHERAVWAAAILHVLDPKYKLLLWGRGERYRAAARLAADLPGEYLALGAEERLGRRVEFEELLPATDLVLVTASGPVATLPISICMAAALPIVATVTYTVGELLQDRHNALLVPKPAPRLLAQRVLDLRQETGVQWTISDMARTEAYEYFSLTRFLDQHRHLYRQLAAGQRVEVPQPAPGAGARFHGLS